MQLPLSDAVANVAPSVTLALTARAAELRKSGVDVLSFTAGEPDFDTPEFIRRAVAEAVTAGGAVCHYTAASGTPELRKAVADKFKRDNGLDYKPSQVLVSTGAKHSLFNAFEAILNPGDEVLIPAPYWVSYPEMVSAVWGKPVILDCARNANCCPTPEQVRAAITPRTRALVLNSPCNPTGAVYDRSQVEALLASLEGTAILVISDEIYEYLTYDGTPHISPAALSADAYSRTVTINGLSKGYAMTGWRVGFAAGPQRIIDAMATLQSHATSNPATICQIAAQTALGGGVKEVVAMREAFSKRRDLMVELLNGIPGLHCARPRGAFYAWVDVGGCFGRRLDGAGAPLESSTAFCEALLVAGTVAAVPGSAFGDDRHIRLSYATSEDAIRRGCERLAAFVARLR